MPFWSSTKASPTLWQASGFAKLEPRFLRLEIPDLPALPAALSHLQIRRGIPMDSAALSVFLSEWYKGSDWTLSLRIEEVESYLRDDQVVVLLATDADRKIVGSIVSTPLTRGATTMSHGANLRYVHSIEGLCIHGDYRSKGLAGTMIGHIDGVTTRLFGPVALLWSRELAMKPYFSTALHTATYAYLQCNRATQHMKIQEVHWGEFCHLWENNCHRFPGIVATVPSNRRGGLRIWEAETHGSTKLAVIADTRRIASDGVPIYEVIWCGWRITNLLFSACEGQHYRAFLESVASQYATPGERTPLFFATSLETGGMAKKRWEDKGPWAYGTSGVHATYLYNYLPPSFGNCLVHAIREEL
jgi:hypothetical protein